MAYGGPLFVNSCYAAIAVALSDIISFEQILHKDSKFSDDTMLSVSASIVQVRLHAFFGHRVILPEQEQVFQMNL